MASPIDPTPQKPAGARPNPTPQRAADTQKPPAKPETPELAKDDAPAPHARKSGGMKETINSVVIAFTLAFVFRGFVIEAFQIPTGSMAPTLMGAHMQFDEPDSGFEWAVGPWYYADNTRQIPLPVQGTRSDPVTVTDPMTGYQRTYTGKPLSKGDHIFVLKGLYPLLPESLGGPARYDVVVFKDPNGPETNFIKRLVGMPGEQVALVDGDVFAREAPDGQTAPWSSASWAVRRKPDRVQREVWQPVFSSAATPPSGTAASGAFDTPWLAGGEGWDTSGAVYSRASGAGSGELRWDSARRPLNDRYAYNETPDTDRLNKYPVSDLRLSMGIALESELAEGDSIACELSARGRRFRAEFTETEVRLTEQPNGAIETTTLASAELPSPLRPGGRPVNVEFWHVDQRLAVYIDDSLALEHLYEWSPSERVRNATGVSLDDLIAREEAVRAAGSNPLPELSDPGRYRRPEVRWTFDTDAALELHRVSIDRDIYYQPGVYGRPGPRNHSRFGGPHASTHPTRNTVVLDDDQFFFCGDNSPASSDGRAWDTPDEWAAATVDDTIGVVHRDLIIGKAFFVYLPAPGRALGGRLPMFDFGKLRFIR